MTPFNLAGFEELASQRLETSVWGFLQGGSDDEVTLRAERVAMERIRLRPRVLVDATDCDIRTTVLGTPISMPVMAAPLAYHGLFHADAECATAEGVGKAGSIFVASMNANRTIEEIAARATGPLWQHIYPQADLSEMESFVRRATDSGYRAFCLTVDRPQLGQRERDLRSGFKLPAHLRVPNFEGGVRNRQALCVATWKTVDWLLEKSRVPLVLKGILTPEDAELAVAHGVAGILVSTHGGRQLDGTAPAIEVLPDVVQAVSGRCEVYCDGGIRRGTDVLKAIALGARAVLIARPFAWGLTVDGAAGVTAVFDILRAEIRRAMALAGKPNLASIDRALVALP